MTYVPIPPTKTTINTTTLQQTIISSLDPVSIHVFEQESQALGNANVSNAPSHRLAVTALATMASIFYDKTIWWPEGITPFYFLPSATVEQRTSSIIVQHN